jgi:hypothetical protein
MNELPDPVDKFLEYPPQLPADAGRRQALAEHTAALLRLPRRRYWPMAAAIAASIAFGAVSTFFVMRSFNVEAPKKVDVDRPQVKDKPADEKPKTIVAKPIDPRELEWKAFDAADDAQRARLYFQAGDLFLNQHADCESAVRCYTQAIRYCAPDDREFRPNDNWLVMALKTDYRKEN